MAKSKRPELDKTAILKECAKGNKTYKEIAKQFGISNYVLTKIRKSAEPNSDHTEMVQRLYQATDRQISHLEERLKTGEAAFDEKEARMLGTIARTLDKIMELTPKNETDKTNKQVKRSKEVAKHDGEAELNLDQLREDLAQRLDGLQQGSESDVSGDPE